MLTREKICEILDIEASGVCVYEMKNWPQIKGFIPSEALNAYVTSHMTTVKGSQVLVILLSRVRF